jgi:phosphatidate cytidylyltransferase
MSPDPATDDRRRRIWIRVIGAPLLVAAVLGIVWGSHAAGRNVGIRALVVLFAAAALREVYAMMRLKGLKPAAWLGIGGLVAAHLSASSLVAESWLKGMVSPEGVAVATVIAILLLMVARHGSWSPADAGATALGFLYLCLTVFVVKWVPTQEGGLWWLLFLLATNKGSDVAAYVAGKTVGRHKLAPVVSPNKTWEGTVAGLVAGGGLGAWILLGPLKPWMGGSLETVRIVAALAVTASAQAGDLVKSSLKRWAGVKDSGALLPEFGGALDMIDSFVVSAPVAWFVLSALAAA